MYHNDDAGNDSHCFPPLCCRKRADCNRMSCELHLFLDLFLPSLQGKIGQYSIIVQTLLTYCPHIFWYSTGKILQKSKLNFRNKIHFKCNFLSFLNPYFPFFCLQVFCLHALCFLNRKKKRGENKNWRLEMEENKILMLVVLCTGREKIHHTFPETK